MRGVLALFFLLLVSLKGVTQLLPSTVGEVYNFEVGDSFEYVYNYGSSVSASSTNTIQVIILKQSFGDSLRYVRSNKSHSITYAGVQPTGIFTNEWFDTVVYTLLDSTIFREHSHGYNPCDTPNTYCVFDTVYFDTGAVIKKINSHIEKYPLGGNRDSAYEEGIGVLWQRNETEDHLAISTNLILRYFHKANGQKGGTPYYFLVSELNDLKDRKVDLCVFPNPASETFQVFLGDLSEGAILKLFDTWGREVKRELILSTTTMLNRSGLENGIYLWQVDIEGEVVGQGKLIFE